jgi:IS5 family transposase
VKAAFRVLIGRVESIVETAGIFCQFAPRWGNLELAAVAGELKRFLPWMKKVTNQARRSQLEGEKVPAAERVFSIFEPHTELIQRGRHQKPVEFGHAVLLCQTPEKFITDYEAFAQRPADCTLTGEVIERHEKLFGQRPGNRSRGLSRFSRRSPRKWDCPPRQTRGQAHFSGRNGPKNEPVPGL